MDKRQAHHDTFHEQVPRHFTIPREESGESTTEEIQKAAQILEPIVRTEFPNLRGLVAKTSSTTLGYSDARDPNSDVDITALVDEPTGKLWLSESPRYVEPSDTFKRRIHWAPLNIHLENFETELRKDRPHHMLSPVFIALCDPAMGNGINSLKFYRHAVGEIIRSLPRERQISLLRTYANDAASDDRRSIVKIRRRISPSNATGKEFLGTYPSHFENTRRIKWVERIGLVFKLDKDVIKEAVRSVL